MGEKERAMTVSIVTWVALEGSGPDSILIAKEGKREEVTRKHLSALGVYSWG